MLARRQPAASENWNERRINGLDGGAGRNRTDE
jgi:hypothetical protein